MLESEDACCPDRAVAADTEVEVAWVVVAVAAVVAVATCRCVAVVVRCRACGIDAGAILWGLYLQLRNRVALSNVVPSEPAATWLGFGVFRWVGRLGRAAAIDGGGGSEIESKDLILKAHGLGQGLNSDRQVRERLMQERGCGRRAVRTLGRLGPLGISGDEGDIVSGAVSGKRVCGQRDPKVGPVLVRVRQEQSPREQQRDP